MSRLVVSDDPFRLWPRQVETAQLIQLGGAPGIKPTILADGVRVIVKRATGTDSPTGYDSRTIARRFHVKPEDLPKELVDDPERMVDLVFRIREDRPYKIIDASRGDDMDRGKLPFIVATCMPWGRGSL